MDGLNPIARTNIAPEVDPPAEPAMYSFAYTAPAAASAGFLCGSGRRRIARRVAQSAGCGAPRRDLAQALAAKTRFVLDLMEERLHGLGASWGDVTVTNIYTVHDVNSLLATEILPRLGPAGQHGVTWHYSRPPIVSIEYEMDLRGGTRE